MNKVNASHILVQTEEEAKNILKRIKSGESFEKLAEEISLCPSGKQGGTLGWFGRGQMVPEFDTACFNSKKGDLIGPVKTQYRWWSWKSKLSFFNFLCQVKDREDLEKD